jgi:hypothetical protein
LISAGAQVEEEELDVEEVVIVVRVDIVITDA